MAAEPSYRVFLTKPLPAFAEQVRAQIMEHGQPELISELRHDPIHKDEYFEILCEIDIDGRKRPESDLAPCPMCQPNKFLHGRLCWFPALQCCAIIGHCCANKEHSADAERRFKEASVLKWQEDYFLAALPLVPEKIRVLGALHLKAEEALRLHKKFRQKGGHLMRRLRDVVRGSGRLQVHFEIERVATGTDDGPAGFRGGNRVFDTRDYGILEGTTALRAQYNPVQELQAMHTALAVWNIGVATEEAAIDAIITMNERQRARGYAVLTNIDHKLFPAFRRKIEDFEAFFHPDNLKRLDNWGRDRDNTEGVEVTDQAVNHGLRQVGLRGAGCVCRLSPQPDLYFPIPDWPAVPKKRG